MVVLPALWAQSLVFAQGNTSVAAPTLSPAWLLPLWTSQGSASKDLSSRELLGQWVYLDFWASWCGPCKQSFPWMGQLQQQLRDAKLQVVAVNLDKQSQPMERFLKQFPGHVPVVWDPTAETAKRFDVQAMPSSYLINPAGQVVWRHRGFHPADSAALLNNIRQRVLG
jgi:thiol-disulfide isomerase/thioredoxin